MVDWSKAPDDAEFYFEGFFRKIDMSRTTDDLLIWDQNSNWESGLYTLEEMISDGSFEVRPTKIFMKSHAALSDNPDDYHNKITSIDLLQAVQDIQLERAKEYEQEGGERSFAKIASVFNTYTGKDLVPSDIALIFEILKNVRFYAQHGLHKDSVIDKISYASLWGELVTEERSK